MVSKLLSFGYENFCVTFSHVVRIKDRKKKQRAAKRLERKGERKMKKFENAKISNQELAKVSGGNYRKMVDKKPQPQYTVEPYVSYPYCLNDDNYRFAANYR
jgi:hypothetical protein